MRRILNLIPKPVLISILALLICAAAFGVLLLTLSVARDQAIQANGRLNADIQTARTKTGQARTDHAYVTENQARYEALLKGDSLIPHTRRTAAAQFTRLAQQYGLTALNYSFQAAAPNSVKAAQAQPASGAFRLSVEGVELKVGAPLDGPIYGFIAEMSRRFPGAVVVQTVELERAAEVTDEHLQRLSEGVDSELVTGTIHVSWRTAQAQEQAGAPR